MSSTPDRYGRSSRGVDELHPFADRRTLQAARRLGLVDADARELDRLVRGDAREFARLTAALVRVGLERDYDGVRALAGSG
jgi:hypothetical protein